MILQFLIVLLLVGVAEAQQDIYTDCLHTAPDGKTYDICRMPDLRKILSETEVMMPKPYVTPDISSKITYCSNGTCETACEQKMKEAMQEIDEILRLNHSLLMERDPGTPRMCLNLSQNAYRQWVRVMKECVK